MQEHGQHLESLACTTCGTVRIEDIYTGLSHCYADGFGRLQVTC
jgi:hypothetical protein